MEIVGGGRFWNLKGYECSARSGGADMNLCACMSLCHAYETSSRQTHLKIHYHPLIFMEIERKGNLIRAS